MRQLLGLLIVVLMVLSQDRELNFQGVLRQPSGKAVTDGDYSVDFKIYTVESNGTAIKTDSKTITVYNGVYSTPIDIEGLPFDQQYWIGLSINGGAELTPRIKLATSPYAMALVGENNKFPSTGTVVMGDSLKVLGNLELSGQLILNNGSINGALTLGDRLKFSGAASIQRGDGNVTSNDLGLYSQRPASYVRFVNNQSSFNWYSDADVNPNGSSSIMSLNKDGRLTLESSLNLSGTGIISSGGSGIRYQ